MNKIFKYCQLGPAIRFFQNFLHKSPLNLLNFQIFTQTTLNFLNIYTNHTQSNHPLQKHAQIFSPSSLQYSVLTFLVKEHKNRNSFDINSPKFNALYLITTQFNYNIILIISLSKLTLEGNYQNLIEHKHHVIYQYETSISIFYSVKIHRSYHFFTI